MFFNRTDNAFVHTSPIASSRKRNYQLWQATTWSAFIFFYYNLADISRQETSGASDRALNEPNSWLYVGIGSRTCGFELWMVFGVRWVIATGGGCRRTWRRAGDLSPTSLSVSLLAFTSLDFMTLSSRTFLPSPQLRPRPRPRPRASTLPSSSSSSARVYTPRSA